MACCSIALQRPHRALTAPSPHPRRVRSVEACPQEFSIESPTIIRDYGYHKGSEATTALGERTKP